MSAPQPGNDGDPVPVELRIFRIGKNTDLSPAAHERRIALPIMFELSSEDKASSGQRLSVWVEELTIADQAWDFMGSKPARTVVACLIVRRIHAIEPPSSFVPLRVEWEKALHIDGNGCLVPNTRPGAEGHVGISGLNQGGNARLDSNRRKELRSKLADIAEISNVPVPHNFEQEHIEKAAYYISMKEDQRSGTQQGDWIRAVRQLRRSNAHLND